MNEGASSADQHGLLAAEGWLELGLPGECLRELARLSPGARDAVDSLNLLWQAHAACRDWPAALEVGRALAEAHPADCSGWIQRSFALHELGRTTEAMDALAPAVDMFPEHPLVRYNMACYACRLGDLEAARAWLRGVARLKGVAYVQGLAAGDADLGALRGEIMAWGKG